MAKEPVFNCELETGDNTMYGEVVTMERISDLRVRLTVKPNDRRQPRVVTLKADGVTNVRTGSDMLVPV